jgi:hypothetical protein
VPVPPGEFALSACLHDEALVKHEGAQHLADGAEAVLRDAQRRVPGPQALDRSSDTQFGPAV